jgi:hypothetical protein
MTRTVSLDRWLNMAYIELNAMIKQWRDRHFETSTPCADIGFRQQIDSRFTTGDACPKVSRG